LMMGYVLDELPAFVRKVISSGTTFSQKCFIGWKFYLGRRQKTR
jgi:hypothetical protein